MSKPKVLFLCTGNSARSQMAEAFLRAYAGDYFDVYSAGLEPKPINPMTYQVMAERGLDLNGHTSKNIKSFIGNTSFEYMITVCAQAKEMCPIFPGMGIRMHWDVANPSALEGSPEEKLAGFRAARDRLDREIRLWLAQHGIHLPD